MQPPRPRHHQPLTELVGTGFAAVVTAVSILNLNTIGGGEEGMTPTPTPADQWQLVLACALLAAGLLLIMDGMRRRVAPPGALFPLLRRAVDVAAAALWNAGGPERALPLPLMILLLFPLLEAWFDFI